MKNSLSLGDVRAILAILFSLTVCGLYACRQTVPNELLAFAGVVVAFYFKTSLDADKALRAEREFLERKAP